MARDCNQKWGSVRKVRYFDDIEAAINYALKYKDALFAEEVFVSFIIERRQNRHNLIQKHYKRGIERTKRSLYSTKFKITLPDTLTFLKEVQIFAIKEGTVKALELTQKWVDDHSENRRRKLILEYVLNSKYGAYLCFLKNLIQLKEFVIPTAYSKRDSRFRAFINKSGFLTDVASFYTIRDLFYELDIVNWLIDDENNLVLYPTISIDEESNKDQWNETLKIDDCILYIWKKLDEYTVLHQLVELYLNQTRRRYMINADLLRIRDIFCRKFKIGDHCFRKILLECSRNEKKPYRFSLNFGLIKSRKRNYSLKLVSLPKVSSNRLALYITIDKEAA